MDQNSNTSPGLHLPQPSMARPLAQPQQAAAPSMPEVQAIIEPPNISEHSEISPAIQHYQQPAAPLPSFIESPAAAQPLAPPTPLPVETEQVNQPQSIMQAQNASDDSADDAWIAKARAIAEQYKHDPYVQSNALSQLKAEYMKARHGKTIKVNDTKA